MYRARTGMHELGRHERLLGLTVAPSKLGRASTHPADPRGKGEVLKVRCKNASDLLDAILNLLVVLLTTEREERGQARAHIPQQNARLYPAKLPPSWLQPAEGTYDVVV